MLIPIYINKFQVQKIIWIVKMLESYMFSYFSHS